MSIYRTLKCPCGDAVCDKWMVSPGADVMGCGWDQKTAQAVTDFLNNGKAENDRLTQENWQLNQACGYPIPADRETPQNPFKCGTCEARTIENDRLREALVKLRETIVATTGGPGDGGECYYTDLIDTALAKEAGK